ncbi:MAG: ABC transporter ATP-binding protein [Chlamydiia bacterium]|nr:ABC transporter ATP-binding protein [Chlamydiia bacterium]
MRFPHIRHILLGKASKNLWPFSLMAGLNFISALFEGLTFGFILLAMGELSGGQKGETGAFLTWVMHYFQLQGSFTLFIVAGVCMQILRSMTAYAGQYTSMILGIRIQNEAQEKIYSQILKFSFACVNRYKSGDLLEYAKMPATMTMPLMNALNGLVVSALMILIQLWMMVYLSVPLTLLVIVTFGSITLTQKVVIRRISKYSQHLQEHIVDFSKQTVQSLNGLRAIHTFCRQAAVMERIRGTLGRIAELSKRIMLWSNIIPSFNEITGISLVAVFLVVGQTILSSSAIPLLLTFILILYRLNTRIQMFLVNLGAIAGNWGQVLRLEEILDESDKQFISHEGVPFPGLQHVMEFRDVSLKYENTKEDAIRSLHVTIRKGQTVAFVGSSGAGKSSFLDLLLRLYDPTSGRITIDGMDLRTFELTSWRDKIGMVSQDTFIFNDTIEENIRFGKLDASKKEIEQAAVWAHADQFIERLPDGYQTVLGERGYRLSGGQRQRIALARALVRNPEILILDEATSNLDSQSERAIQNALAQFYGQKTLIIVAHRLSTIFHADQIIVLERGSFIESGTHQELLETKGRYASLWNIQSQHVDNIYARE